MTSWKLSSGQKVNLTHRYAAGEKVAAIAADLGITTRAVSRLARVRGQPPRASVRVTERSIQRAVVAHLAQLGVPGLVAFHVPNGGKRNPIEAKMFKAEGVKAGIPDILIIHAGQVHCLELKTEHGRLSEKQLEAQDNLKHAGAIVHTAYGLDQAIRTLEGWGLLKGGHS